MLVYGHRGAMGEAPENTLAGFRYAYEIAGVRNFELDVHLTRDGELAVIHDDSLDRTTNGRGRVADRTMDELRGFDARAFFPNFRPAQIPTLGEVLDVYSRAVHRFQIEIKTDLPERLDRLFPKLCDLVRRFDIEKKTTVTSFDPYALEGMRKLDDSLSLGLISYHYTDEILKTAIDLGCVNACIPLKAGNAALVRKARDKGLEVTGWLGNTKDDIDTLLEWGVTEITTNFPSFALPYLAKRGIRADQP